MRNNYLTNQDFSRILRGKISVNLVLPIARILAASLGVVDPYQAVDRAVKFHGGSLLIDQRQYDLNAFRRVLVVSFGKAAELMAQAIDDLLGERIAAGIVVDKGSRSAPVVNLPNKYMVIHSDHPIPGVKSLQAGKAIMDFLVSTSPKDLVLFLISGGGSALITSPYEGISIDDMQALTQLLLNCGAAINEINGVRKHLDRVKGGGLAKAAIPAQMVSLVLSDVIGNPLESIASGPTVTDPTTFSDAISILEKFDIWNSTPESIQHVLLKGRNGEIAETLKPGEQMLDNSQVKVVASNEHAAEAGMEAALQEEFNAHILTNSLQGEAFATGVYLGNIAHKVIDTGQPVSRPACVIAGGETTVVVGGDGLGGRNLEVALGAVDRLAGLDNVALITLATDGEDGPTDAAGAIVTGKTGERARDIGLTIVEYRNKNDSYHFFESLNALIKTGSTGTNVNDLNFLFLW